MIEIDLKDVKNIYFNNERVDCIAVDGFMVWPSVMQEPQVKVTFIPAPLFSTEIGHLKYDIYNPNDFLVKCQYSKVGTLNHQYEWNGNVEIESKTQGTISLEAKQGSNFCAFRFVYKELTSNIKLTFKNVTGPSCDTACTTNSSRLICPSCTTQASSTPCATCSASISSSCNTTCTTNLSLLICPSCTIQASSTPCATCSTSISSGCATCTTNSSLLVCPQCTTNASSTCATCATSISSGCNTATSSLLVCPQCTTNASSITPCLTCTTSLSSNCNATCTTNSAILICPECTSSSSACVICGASNSSTICTTAVSMSLNNENTEGNMGIDSNGNKDEEVYDI